jgi:dUTP pyrophosphatase
MIVKFKKLNERAVVPQYKTLGAAGADLVATGFSLRSEWPTLRIYPGQIVIASTGLSIEIPPGYEGQIRPRSGLGSKGITVVNTPGTIDEDFRGEIKIFLINSGEAYHDLNVGDRVAQLVISPVFHATFEEVKEVTQTERGVNGFGSTGVS